MSFGLVFARFFFFFSTASFCGVQGAGMIERHYLRHLGFVYVRMRGRVDNEAILRHVEAFNREAADMRGVRELADTRDVTDIEALSVDGLITSARREEGQGRSRGGRLAVIVASDLHYGMSRAFATLVEGRRQSSSVFYDVREALTWLGFGEEIDEVLHFVEKHEGLLEPEE